MKRPLAIALWLALLHFPLECAASQEPDSLPPVGEQILASDDGGCAAGGLQYVTARIRAEESMLTVGEEGHFDLRLGLPRPGDSAEESMRWDPNAPGPVLWVSAPPESGILLHPPDGEGGGNGHVLRQLTAPVDDSGIISTRISYSVTESSAAGGCSLTVVIEADLVTPDSERKRDVGQVFLPVTVDTHLSTKLLVLVVISVAVFLFVVEWVRVDVVAIIMMLSLPILGLIDGRAAFQGLSSNAVVAVIGVMIVSFGLNRTGLVGRAIRPLLRLIGSSPGRLLVLFSSLIAVISSVMQNTGAAVLFLPAIRTAAADKVRTPISRVLMPIGMAAILGGTLTMIGTSPLILLNDLLPAGMARFSLLELTPIGIALAAAGVFYLSTLGRRILAQRPVEGPEEADLSADDPDQFGSYGSIQGPFEITVPEDYVAGGGPQALGDIRRRLLVDIVAVAASNGTRDCVPPSDTLLCAGISLCAYGPEDRVRAFAQDYGFSMRQDPDLLWDLLDPAVAGKAEVIIPPRSSLIGCTIEETGFRETYRVNPLALQQGRHVFYRGMADVPLRSGDAILAQGTWEAFAGLTTPRRDFIVVSSNTSEVQQPDKAKRALLCFLGTLALMLFSSFYYNGRDLNPIPLSVCLMAGAVGMVACRVMTIGEAYGSVDWRTVFLLGGLIPLGMAVQQTGTAEWIARGIVSAFGSSMTPLLLLIILSVMSAAFTLVMSNVGACTLLVPLGISIAHQIGIDPRVAAIAVGLGVSNSFLLPTHQVNALYMGPGKYHTTDYVRIGAPLSVIYAMVLVAMIYFFYL
jgi:di/tricarboxylate transporter